MVKTKAQRIALARHSPVGLGQYQWPYRPGKDNEEQFYYRAHKTNRRLNRALLKLHDPSNPVKILVVSEPPRTGKSILCSRLHPPWYMGKHPHRNALITGYSSDLCEDFSAFGRDLLKEHGGALYGLKVDPSFKSKKQWKIVGRGGGVRAASIMGQITGYGFNHITCDDLYKGYQEAHSEATRRSVWNELGSTIDTRLENPWTMLMIGTRWHPDDAIGRYEAMAAGGDPSIMVIKMPAQAPEDMYDEDGELFAKKGELLYPWQWDHEKLEFWHKKNGPYMYSALFDCNPTTPEGTFWQESLFTDLWFTEWPELQYLVTTIDPAAGAEVTQGCDSALIASGTNYGERYYIDCDLKPSGPVETVQRYESFVDRLPRVPDALGIEHNATQVQSMIDKIEAMKRRRGWTFPVFEIPIKRDLGDELGNTRDKNIKIQTLDPYFHDRQFRFKSGSPGASRLVSQCKYYGVGNQLVDGLDAMEMAAEFYSQLWEGHIRLQ